MNFVSKPITQLQEAESVTNDDQILVYNGTDGKAYRARGTLFRGDPATINGVNTLTIDAGENITATQEGDTLHISATDTVYDAATTSVDGLMSAADKVKLDGVASGAEVNVLESVSVNGNAVSVADKTAALTLDKSTVGLGNVDNTSDANKPVSTAQQAALDQKVNVSAVGTANGVAELDSNGKIPAAQLPSYVDDVLEYSSRSAFPATGESGKIYVATDTNLSYRWSGSGYVEISPSIALGETSSTAYRGDRGKTAYDHSQATGNAHSMTKADIGLGNVDNTSDANKPVSTATKTALNQKVDKVSGKGLSTNDYTTPEKNKLESIESGANATTIDATLSNSGQAADAKATGDKITALETENVLLRELVNGIDAPIYRTASGNPATFADGYPANVKALSVEITPTQEGEGDPYPPGGGKNLFEITAPSATVSGVTFTVNRDAAGNVTSVTANGTATATNSFKLGRMSFQKGASYILSGTPSGQGSGKSVIYAARYDDRIPQQIDYGNGVNITPDEDYETNINIVVYSGVTVSNVEYLPMIRLASDADPTFAPYSNIRPISGATSVSVTRTGKNLLDWPDRTVTLNGVTAVSSGGVVTLSGTASALTQFPCAAPAGMRPGTYILSGCPDGGGNESYDLRRRERIDYGSGVSFEADESNLNAGYFITVRSGVNADGLIFRPMIRPASGSDATFAPYQGQIVTVSLVDSNSDPLTVYGGTLNVMTGELTVTHKTITITGDETGWVRYSNRVIYLPANTGGGLLKDAAASLPGTGNSITGICNFAATTEQGYINKNYIQKVSSSGGIEFSRVDFAFGMKSDYTVDDFTAVLKHLNAVGTPLQVCYLLATPVTYRLTPAQLATLSGYNSVTTDAGTLSVTYRADPAITLGGG